MGDQVVSAVAPVLKDESSQCSVPTAWRKSIFDIVEQFVHGDFTLSGNIDGVRAISTDRAERIAKNVASYGGRLTNLPEDAWVTSVCQWMRDYWDVLVDLYVLEEGESDLVMSIRVYEERGYYVFEVISVHVP